MATKKRAVKPAGPTSAAPSREIDADFVAGLYRSRIAQGDEAKLRVRITEMRALCNMEHKLHVPPQYEAITREVRTPFANDALLRITAALTQHPPVAHVEPINDE